MYGEVIDELEEELAAEAGNIFVEKVVNQHRDPVVVPVPVHQDDLLKEFEFGEGEIRRPDRCSSLLAHDAQTHMRLLQDGVNI